MQRICTCTTIRALTSSAEVAARHVTSRSNAPITSTSINHNHHQQRRRAFSALQAQRYPRSATPFGSTSSSLSSGNAPRSVSDEVEELDSLLREEELRESSNSGGTASSSQQQPWYLQESLSSSSSSSSSSPAAASTPRTPKPAPPPPSTLPTYLRPLWNHLYESPFLDQRTLSLIDCNAVQANANVSDMDASVSSWVDWVAVASLRKGRERGIRGASEGVKVALKECLKAFDAELALQEAVEAATAAATASSSTSTTAAPPSKKRKQKIPMVLVEGLDIKEPQWCLVDGSKAVVHIMTAHARDTWEVEGVASGFSQVRQDSVRIGDLDLESEDGSKGEFWYEQQAEDRDGHLQGQEKNGKL